MNSKLLAAVVAASVIGLSGCASMDRQTAGTVGGAANGTQRAARQGAADHTAHDGAAAGAYIGNQATKR